MKERQMIIFTDLDGTLLDRESYSPDGALPALRAAEARGVPVVFCSSKTRAEIEALRQDLDNHAPFIVENGGAVFIPAGSFPFTIEPSVRRAGYEVIELGTPYQQLVRAFHLVRACLPERLVGFSDLTIEEVANECALPLEAAARAKLREYDEPFRWFADAQSDDAALQELIHRAGLRCSQGGRFWHLHGASDKGEAVARLIGLYEKQYGEVLTIGLGDSATDLPLLAAVDLPFIVRKQCGSHDAALCAELVGAERTDGAGPQGWAQAVGKTLNQW